MDAPRKRPPGFAGNGDLFIRLSNNTASQPFRLSGAEAAIMYVAIGATLNLIHG